MKYYDALRKDRLINLTKQLENPTLMRLDINLPMDHDGNLYENSWRMQVNSDIITLLSNYTGLVLMSHQGRPKEPPTKTDYEMLSLEQHERLLQKVLPRDVNIDLVKFEEIFTPETKKKIKDLGPGKVLLLDNIRFSEDEYKFDPETCNYIPFFKSAGIKTCVNEAIPTWHRAHSSLMSLPHIARTYIGMRSSYELKLLNEAMKTDGDKAVIIGGAKLKEKYLMKISDTFDIYTGGVPGIIMTKAKGHGLGDKNEAFIKSNYTPEEVDWARNLWKKCEGKIETPSDFVVIENGEKYNIYTEELNHCKGVIRDIGEATVEDYAEKLQNKEIRIRGGPLGVFEEGYDNGVELTRRIVGEGMMFLGGDTSQEIIMYNLDRPILNSGGNLLISGGAFLHGMADERYPSIDSLMEFYK